MRTFGSALALAAALVVQPLTATAQPSPPLPPPRLGLRPPRAVPDGTQPWLGVTYAPANGAIGARVIEVFEESAAANAGIVIGDVILEFDGVTLASPDLLPMLIARQRVGDVITMSVARNNRVRRISATLSARVDEGELLYRRLVGRLAPDVRLARLDGGVVTLPSSSVTVLVWFTMRNEGIAPIASELAAWRDRAGTADVDVFAVTEGAPEAVRSFVARTPLPLPVAFEDPATLTSDQGITASTHYTMHRGTSAAPTVVVIDRRGVVRFAAAIDEADHAGLDDALAAADRVIAAARHDR